MAAASRPCQLNQHAVPYTVARATRRQASNGVSHAGSTSALFARALARRRRGMNLCKCGRKRAAGRSMCRKCLDYFKNRQVELHESRYIDGRCTDCGSPNLAERVFASGERRKLKVCQRCRERELQKGVDRHKKPRKARNVRKAIKSRRCIECRQPAHYDASKGVWRRLCLGHLEAASERYKRWYRRTKAA
jgi:hypothetical protein